MATTNVETLKINRLSQAQYDAAKQAGTLSDTELYLTPESGSGGMTGTTYTVTIPSSSWTQSGDYYTKTVTVSGLKATYPVSPVVDCSLSGSDADADKAVIEAFKKIAIIITAENSITVKAINESPDVNVPLIINVWE